MILEKGVQARSFVGPSSDLHPPENILKKTVRPLEKFQVHVLLVVSKQRAGDLTANSCSQTGAAAGTATSPGHSDS